MISEREIKCVCEREREGERGETERERESVKEIGREGEREI